MDQSPQQQVVQRIADATNILVTVSANPSVDQLAACIGFTLLLNKLGKHATAVFSGQIPSTIEFLQPEKTLEANTDSLRDFIIALDKSKADKLRYKVEDDFVRIFITPYRTSISEKDLEFSQGDFNVDVVIALGVSRREDIDQAIIAHGRILHDAVVISLTAGNHQSDVGSIAWHDQNASSLSEMLASIADTLQQGALDAQMSTAFLTGIVAETNRFSNELTTPRVMTISAQLMAAGANQQLVATQLAPPPQPPANEVAPTTIPDATAELGAIPQDQMPQPIHQPAAPKPASAPAPALSPNGDGEVDISHPEEAEIHIDDQGNLKRLAELEAQAKEAGQHAQEMAGNPSLVPAEEPFLATGSQRVIQPLSPSELGATPATGGVPPANVAVPTAEVTLPEISLPPLADSAASEPQAVPPAAPVQPPQPVLPPAASLTSADAAITDLPNATSLSDIEASVNSPHAAPNPVLATAEAVIDDARHAVEQAAIQSEPRPEATLAVGAQFVDLNPPQAADQPSSQAQSLPQPQPPVASSPMSGVADIPQQPMAPPPVPPPMMPPAGPPKAHHNPYLNPPTVNQQQSDTSSDPLTSL